MTVTTTILHDTVYIGCFGADGVNIYCTRYYLTSRVITKYNSSIFYDQKNRNSKFYMHTVLIIRYLELNKTLDHFRFKGE